MNVRLRKSYMLMLPTMELWHVLNRGVDGRDIFMDDGDRARFVHNLYEFNDAAPAQSPERRLRRGDSANVRLRKSYIRERIVKIHGWVEMKSHYHLLLSELVEGGIILFLRKLNIGYAKYFNEKHGRVGTLFQSRTKKVLVERQAQFLYILHYLHLNPLDYLQGAEWWRVRDKAGIGSTTEALRYLETYRWSSYMDYVGMKNFPSLVEKDLFEGRSGEYAADLCAYLSDAESRVLDLGSLTLE